MASDPPQEQSLLPYSSLALETTEEANNLKDLEQRLVLCESEVKELRLKSKNVSKQINGLAFVVVAMVIAGIMKWQLKDANAVQDLVKDLERPERQPPLYYMYFSGGFSTIMTLYFMGPPSFVSGGISWGKMVYQGILSVFLLLGWMSFFHQAIEEVQKLEKECCIHNSKFVRAHDPQFRKDATKLYPGDVWVFKQLVNNNGGMISPYGFICAFVFFCLWPAMMVMLVPLVIVAIMYSWFLAPIVFVNYIFIRHFLVGFLMKAAKAVRATQEWKEVALYDAVMVPFAKDMDSDVSNYETEMRFVLYDDHTGGGTFEEVEKSYKAELDCFYTIGISRKAFSIYLNILLAGTVLFTLVGMIQIRIFTGQGYVPSLWYTISERHWYTYLHYQLNTYCGRALMQLLGLQ